MNSDLKISLLVAVLGFTLHVNLAFAETSSDAAASDATQTRRTKDPASAQGYGGHSSPPYHETADNARPVVTPQGPALFKLIDTDKDGRISLAEYVAYGKSADSSTSTGKADNAQKNASIVSASGSASAKRDASKTGHADNKPAAVPKPDSPGPSMMPSVSTRREKFTAEVFEILDIDHDHFLTQKELDALVGAHQISQP